MTATHAIDPTLAAALRAAHEREERDKRSGRDATLGDDLNAGELDVLRLTADGLEDREIANALQLSLDAIKTRQAKLRRKLGARGRAHAVHLSHQRGLL